MSSHFWELESWWTPEPLERNFRGQNPLDWEVIYIIKKILELRCLKWARMTHLNTSNTSYGQKKSWESNCQFDSQPLKVRNRLDFLACRWRATYRWKALDKGYNFALDLISIKGLHVKLWAPKVAGILVVGISKWHLGANPEARHKVNYRGEGGGFPPSPGHGESCEFVFARDSSVHQSASTMH
jgi:hypothetical protein